MFSQPNTIAVLNSGDAVLMPWAGSVNAILEMWYPGQMGGHATANVLIAKVDPGGCSRSVSACPTPSSTTRT